MRLSAATILLSAAALVASATAQTTGVPTTNDLTVNSLGSGKTSSSLFGDILDVDIGVVTFEVTCEPGSQVLFLFSLDDVIPANFWLPPQNVCAPAIPYNGTTNQWFDLDVVGLLQALAVDTDFDGVVEFQIPFSTAMTFATQAVILNTCATGLFPLVMTQAFNVNVT